jgi:hypothetical protein
MCAEKPTVMIKPLQYNYHKQTEEILSDKSENAGMV